TRPPPPTDINPAPTPSLPPRVLYPLPPPPPSSPLFPYTTLFRSLVAMAAAASRPAWPGLPLIAVAIWASTAAGGRARPDGHRNRSEEHTSELQSLRHLVCRLLLEKKKKKNSRRL